MTPRQHYIINLRLALPVMIGQLGQIMVSVADSIMVGQLGTLPLAAVALGNSVYVVFMVFGIGVSFGITPLVATAEGMRRNHLQGALLRHALWVDFILSLLLFGLLALTLPFLGLLEQDEGVVPLARPYLLIIGASIVPLMLFQGLKQFAEGLSDTKQAMKVIVFCNLINIALNYLLIFGNFGFPQLGIEGAGWSTLIARILMVALMGWYVLKSRKFKKRGLALKGFTFRKNLIRRLIQLGVPMGLQYIFEVSAFALAAIFAGMISATALAAHQIAINIASVSYMAVTGLGAAATVRIGNQAGMGDAINLRRAASTIFKMAVAWMSLTGIAIFFFRDSLAGFYSNDPEVLSLAISMLIVAVFFQLSDGLQAVALGALRGFTDVKIPTWITFGVYWGLVLPSAYYLSQHTSAGAMGIWYALAGGLTLSALFLSLRFRKLLARFAAKMEKKRQSL